MVGPVDSDVTANAFTTRREAQPSVRDVGSQRIDVTLEAQESPLPSYQQIAIHTAVRCVACDAALQLHGRVLEDERPAFLDMASDACLPIGALQHRLVAAPMRIVTIRTLHETLRNRMVCRQGELSLDGGVTTEAQFRLTVPEQVFGEPAVLLPADRSVAEEVSLNERCETVAGGARSAVGQMGRVAVLTRNAIQLMLRVVKVSGCSAGFVAIETLRRILGRGLVERENQSASDFSSRRRCCRCHRACVRSPAPMAALTSHFRRGVSGPVDQGVVRGVAARARRVQRLASRDVSPERRSGCRESCDRSTTGMSSSLASCFRPRVIAEISRLRFSYRPPACIS